MLRFLESSLKLLTSFYPTPLYSYGSANEHVLLHNTVVLPNVIPCLEFLVDISLPTTDFLSLSRTAESSPPEPGPPRRCYNESGDDTWYTYNVSSVAWHKLSSTRLMEIGGEALGRGRHVHAEPTYIRWKGSIKMIATGREKERK